eukprot:m.47937 g.47937  ORF g.47937 m.47937 type:complete len:86 (-) comp15746_c0_seq4:1275-1532(-)
MTPDFDFTQHRARGGQCPERTSCCLPNSFVEDAFRILVAHSPPSLRSAISLLLTVRCLRVIWCGLSVRINAHWRPESLCQLMACL